MIINESFIRDFLRLLVWFPLRWSAAYQPVSLSLLVFKVMGDLQYLFARTKRQSLIQIMGKHLKGEYSERELKSLVRGFFRQHMLNTLFPFIVPKLDQAFLDDRVEIQGRENIDRALAEGHGCILIQGHVGIVQFPLYYLNALGYNLGQIFYRHTQGLSWVGQKVQLRYRERMEQRLNVRLFAVDGFQRPVMKWLQDNNVLMLNGDGIGGREFVGRYEPLTFLDEQTLFPLGPYNLALKIGSPLLPTQVAFDGTRFRITILPALRTSETGQAALFDLARKFSFFLETRILEQPDTWHFWDSFQPGLLIQECFMKHQTGP
ncbi:lysophospholipid acyltransferase family protein [bacterium]|nr:lysophospholipid acyltransferase family protein [bacterium]